MSASEPVRVESIEDEPDACKVVISFESYEWLFTVEHLNLRRSDLQSSVSVDWTSGGGSREASGLPIRPLAPQNLNWRSVSALSGFVKRMESYYGKETMPWPILVEWVAGAVTSFVRQPLVFEAPDWAEDTATSYLLNPLIPSSGVTILFGPGDAGKGYLTLALLFSLSYNLPICGPRPDGRRGAIYYIDYEDSKEEWDKRLTRLAVGQERGLPANVNRIPGRGVPFAEMADGLISQLGGVRPRLLVIDSALPAAGGDISRETEPVRQFFAAVSRFRCPVLLIAHETKSDEGDTYPYGSIFWHNLARWTINVRGAEHAPLERHMLLRHRKHNSGPRFRDMAFSLSFSDDEAGETPGWTKLRQIEMRDMTAELQEKRAPAARLAELLSRAEDGMTVKDLAAKLGATETATRKALQRGDQYVSDGVQGRGNQAIWRVK